VEVTLPSACRNPVTTTVVSADFRIGHEDKISDRRQRICGGVVPQEVCRQSDLLNVGRGGSPPYQDRNVRG
jgi:hypothetical protein